MKKKYSQSAVYAFSETIVTYCDFPSEETHIYLCQLILLDLYRKIRRLHEDMQFFKQKERVIRLNDKEQAALVVASAGIPIAIGEYEKSIMLEILGYCHSRIC